MSGSDKPPFAVDMADPIKWVVASTPEELRAQMRLGWEIMKREEEEERRNPRPRIHYVHPKEFEEYVAAGICDRKGRWK